MWVNTYYCYRVATRGLKDPSLEHSYSYKIVYFRKYRINCSKGRHRHLPLNNHLTSTTVVATATPPPHRAKNGTFVHK